MVSRTKIHVTYQIKDPPMIVEPYSEIEGTIIVANQGVKDQKLKEVFIDLVERYDRDSDEGWDAVRNKLQSFRFNTRGMIRSGETHEIDFRIALPKWPKVKKGRRFGNWSIQLHFKQKTKLVASRGSLKANATCILPVRGTQVGVSFGNPNIDKGKKKKKRRKK